ncbi:MAG TPA: CbiX/SirB N-terminal domain-containing protein [Casimicrobiaceae bacterium]|nr:CbiX/SirB N-terminal domain-containing protein [Casimicrobiaceae bacterium]
MSANGLILYVHGARDPRWAEPFTRLRDRIAKRRPALPVAVAFLEHMSPDLAQAAIDIAARGADRIRVVPMFFGRGGHLREDLPRQIEAARARLPGIVLELTEAAGESDAVQEALATFVLDGLQDSSR